MSGVVPRRYEEPLSPGGLGVRVDPSVIDGQHGVLLVPTFVGIDPENVPGLLFEDVDALTPVVRAYRVQRDHISGLYWTKTADLKHVAGHAERYALSIIAGSGRLRA